MSAVVPAMTLGHGRRGQRKYRESGAQGGNGPSGS